MYLIGFLITGLAVGYLAGKVTIGEGYGIFWDMVVGAVGALVGGLAFSLFYGTYTTGLLIAFLVAVIAAAVLVAILHVVASKEKREIARP
jgi:uncharacterized membrane protein YeaQ/YmgE (transglycosylase-associated protein family)